MTGDAISKFARRVQEIFEKEAGSSISEILATNIRVEVLRAIREAMENGVTFMDHLQEPILTFEEVEVVLEVDVTAGNGHVHIVRKGYVDYVTDLGRLRKTKTTFFN